MPDPTSPSAVVPALHPAPRLGRLVKNALANLLRVGTTFLAVLLVPPLLVHFLDRPAYATWMLVLQVGAYATLFDGGLQLAIGRYVARAEHAGDRAYLAEILSSTAGLLSAAALLVLLILGLLALLMGRLFSSIPLSLLPQAQWSLLLIGGSLGLAFPTSVLAGLYLGLERNKVNAIAGAVSKLLGAAGSVWAAQHHQGLIIMAAWIAAGNLLQPVIFLFASRNLGLSSLFKFTFIRIRTMSDFARFCSAMTVSQLGMLLISGLDLPIVAAYDFTSAGYYALAATLANMMIVPINTILSTLVPMISGLSAANQAESVSRVLFQCTRWSNAMLAIMASVLMLGMPTLLQLWVGTNYAKHTLVFGELLVLAQLVRLSMAGYALVGFGAGEQSRMLVSPALEGLANLVLSLILVRHMGAVGVALGTLMGAFVGVALHFFNSMPRTRSIPFKRSRFLLEGVLQPIGWMVPPSIALALALRFVPATRGKLFVLLIGTVAMCLVSWSKSLRSDERTAVRGLSKRLLAPVLRLGRSEI